ncbi:MULTISPECIES: serine hydrolase domain-containing protein [Stenotrophomonas]|nr:MULTISPECIES: serine hydrolase domain-containing protein [Stenotrophomonas]MBU2047436.1 beta-lactamase family protein [Gammaproteobacteria bacterium]RLK50099.1 CubicO group peptidase (beta-lactamase class C family) [Stenotrophomonas rhizophila]
MRTRYLRIVAGGLVAAIAICGGASASSTLPALQSGGGGGNAADLDPAVTRRIDADVQQVMQRFQVPGAAIAVIVDGKPLYSRAYGLRDRERALPVRTDTPFEIGSITKQFTAAAIVQLQEAGKVQLDDPLARYLPHAPHASEVTLRHLLTHTSGLHEYFDGPEAEVDDLVTRPIDFDDLIARIAGQPLDFPPGTRWSYSNTGYALLGKVIETVSGEHYRDYLQQHMLAPLGMTHTFTLADSDRLAGMAVGYRHEQGALQRSPYFHPDWSGAAGFLVSTLDDLARWDAALSGGKVVSAAGYAQMKTSFATADGKPVGYGLGLFVDAVYGQARVGHTGGAQGFTTADEYYPDHGLRILAFTNLGDKKPEAGVTMTNLVFAALHPDIVAAWERPVAGEVAAVRDSAKASFRQLQNGTDYSAFSDDLRGKLAAGIGAGLMSSVGPYGEPTDMVFKGTSQGEKGTLYSYVAEFGPGAFVGYTVRLDETGHVAGFAIE